MERRDEPREDEDGSQSGPVVHGGEGDPLGGGVADLEDDGETSEGPDDGDETSERE